MEETTTIAELILRFKKEMRNFKTEEDVRIGTNEIIKELTNSFKINIEAGHEVTSVYGGRADSIYSNVLFEYKAPNKFDSTKGIEEALYGRNKRDHGLMHYLINFTLEEVSISNNDEIFREALFRKVGVGFDGNKMIFGRFLPSNELMNLYDEDRMRNFPDNINTQQYVKFEYEIVTELEIAFKKLILMLRSTTRKRLSSIELLKSFGPESTICKQSINYLYNLLDENLITNSRVKTLFAEWNRIFGNVYGDIETDFTSFSKDLIEMYSLNTIIEIHKFLFVLQTYYNIVLKLLIHTLLESLSNPFENSSKPQTKTELLALFSGREYTNYKIENFFEIHFFEWFIFIENFENKIIQDILIELDTFETTASVIKPEIIEDVLKDMYLNLMPSKLRHLMGEYYTPGWLVDFALDRAGYNGEPTKTILDPTCGSGSFLTHAIKRLKTANNGTYNIEDIIRLATENIVGYDINPISVISAKTNYILALGDITNIHLPITIPIYMCDSILVPTVHAKQNETKHTIEINTVVGSFKVPVFPTREANDIFLKEASRCVLQEYTFEEFIKLVQLESKIPFDSIDINIVKAFYDKLISLHLSGRNGFWPIILKNSFAPLFARGCFDIVVGNPPWISWKSMSDTYRKSTLDIWLSYGIFEKNAYDKITTHDDFAMAVTYVSIDHYVKDNGYVVFILPQTFLKSAKGGEGFRKFRITRDKLDIPFAVKEVYDMVDIKPFKEYASNRAALIVFQKDMEMKYPMHNYFVCLRRKDSSIEYTDSLFQALNKMNIVRHSARPINSNPRSPWLTGEEANLNKKEKYLGTSSYEGRKGIEPCGAKGIYLLNIKEEIGKDVKIVNLIERSRLKKAKEYGVRPGIIEKTFIYPMIGGRNIDKWGINSYLYMLVPHYNTGDGIYRGVPESDMKIQYPKTYSWLYQFKDLLLETRIRNAKFFNANVFPFYRLDNVGSYTFMPYKVVWREQHKKMTACVIGSVNDPFLGQKIIITDSKVLYCSLDNEDESHYLCAIINSPTIAQIIEGYTIDTQRGIDILKNIRIPKYDPEKTIHKKIAYLSKIAHKAYIKKDLVSIQKCERIIDNAIKKIF
ncbi:MAG: hypothetical protein PWQ83_1980 [Thermosipho sp. (in: thermotogales)]|nr:hypothetical protein [Thermosipho sp. (in: thermotogales)]